MSTHDETTALTEVVARLAHAQNHEDVDAFVALFRKDAIWTTGGGRLLIGRDAIADFTAAVLPGAMTDLVGTYEVVHVLFLRPDVAAVKVRQRMTGRDGTPSADGYEGSPMYVMTKEDDGWLLAANQNTVVVD